MQKVMYTGYKTDSITYNGIQQENANCWKLTGLEILERKNGIKFIILGVRPFQYMENTFAKIYFSFIL